MERLSHRERLWWSVIAVSLLVVAFALFAWTAKLTVAWVDTPTGVQGGKAHLIVGLGRKSPLAQICDGGPATVGPYGYRYRGLAFGHLGTTVTVGFCGADWLRPRYRLIG